MLEKLRGHWNSKNSQAEKHGSAEEVMQDGSALSGEATVSDAEHQALEPVISTAAAAPKTSQDDDIATNERRRSQRLSSLLRKRSSSVDGKATDLENAFCQQPDPQSTSAHKFWHGISSLGKSKNDESASKSMPEERPELSTFPMQDQTTQGIA